MAYKTMRVAFHEGNRTQAEELAARLALPETVRLGFSLGGNELFFTMVSDVYQLLLSAAKLDKEIAKLTAALPARAVEAFKQNCLIEDIVLTNQIEGVRSTKKEIAEVLMRLRQNDRRGRFAGLVQKYIMLCSGQPVPLETPADIRALYDELVLPEVVAEDPTNAPDGILFREKPVTVCNAGGEPVHTGVQPEEAIVAALERGLAVLEDERLEPLCRAAVFHFVFSFVHPFYDGNGRTNRFISSYVLNQAYEPLVGLRLSYAVKENLSAYYKAFEVCEHPLNAGDLTPFVIAFGKIAVKAMEDVRDALQEKSQELRFYGTQVEALAAQQQLSAETAEVAQELVAATLFSAYGAETAALSEEFGVTRQTVYKRVDPLRQLGVAQQRNVGRTVYYVMNLAALDERGEADGSDDSDDLAGE